MNNLVKDLLLVLVLLLIVGGYTYFEIKKKIKRDENKLYDFLISKKSALYSYISDLLSSFNFEEELDTLMIYELFKEDCIRTVQDALHKRFSSNDYNWLNISDEDKKMISLDYLKKCAEEILNSDELDHFFADIFVTQISYNIKEMEKIEQEAIQYNSDFGEDSDSLHPAEKTKDKEQDDEYKSIEDLFDTGTIEDIDDE